MSRDSCVLASFFLFALASQVNFLWPGSLIVLYALAIGLSTFGLNSLKIRAAWFKYVLIFCIFFVLSFISYFFGAPGELKPRFLFLFFLVLTAMLYVAFNLNEDHRLRKRALDIVVLSIWIEVAIILLQFSYITWRLGIAPSNEDAEVTGFITGSYGNANNVAVIIVLELLLVINKNRIRRNFAGYCLIIFAGCAIFLTLSRTAFVIYLTLFLYFSFKLEPGSGRKKSFKMLSFFAFFMLSLGLITNVGELGQSDNIVIMRSLDRLSTLGSIEEDSSVQFRVTSMSRLGENIGNLGMGTMSDLNYKYFFKDNDHWLAKVNPHSLIAEASFLFGYIGLALVLIFFAFCFLDLFRLSGNLITTAYIFSIFLFFQSVPSSVLSLPLFFYVLILICKMNDTVTSEVRNCH